MVAHRFSFLALYALAATLLFHSWSTPDVWFHLAMGRAVLATGSINPPDSLLLPNTLLINVYWLFQITMYAIFAAGGVIYRDVVLRRDLAHDDCPMDSRRGGLGRLEISARVSRRHDAANSF